jgi:hypothetical protein
MAPTAPRQSPEYLQQQWGSRYGGHPIFTVAVHSAALANRPTTERDYWQWLSDRSTASVWTPETGWLA